MAATRGYERTIREIAAEAGFVGVDPRHIEAWMRLEHGTPDHLSRASFRSEVTELCELIREAPAESESLAVSYGL